MLLESLALERRQNEAGHTLTPPTISGFSSGNETCCLKIVLITGSPSFFAPQILAILLASETSSGGNRDVRVLEFVFETHKNFYSFDSHPYSSVMPKDEKKNVENDNEKNSH